MGDTATLSLMHQATMLHLPTTSQLQYTTSLLQLITPLQLTMLHPTRNQLTLMSQLNTNTNTLLLMNMLESTLEPMKLVMDTPPMANTVLSSQIAVPKLSSTILLMVILE